MATTLLAKKSGTQDNAIATDDDHHEALASDPAISQFPEGTSMASTSTGFGGGFGNGTTNTTTSNTGFGASSNGGFGSTGSTGTGTSTGFGASPAPNTSHANNVSITQNQSESIKSGGGAMQSGGESTVALDKDATDWINKKMRPMMGWVYMLTCTCDFVIFPILWSLLQALSNGQVTSQWQPLTLQGAGLYHIAMGAVLGIAAYGRTKEKVAGVA
jgi:hypothetical protein